MRTHHRGRGILFDRGDARLSDGLEKEDILSAIRRWSERRQQEDPGDAIVKRRVADEIGGYLGPSATGRILEQVTERSKLFPAVEPVLAIFLGSRAAALLLHRIVETAIVRI